MPQRLSTAARDFENHFAAFLARKREISEDVDAAVRDIIGAVRTRGDAALIELTAKFDQLHLTPASLRLMRRVHAFLLHPA